LALGAVAVRKTPLFRPVLSVLEWLDAAVLRVAGLNLMAWQVTFELIKRA
jgi:hypothetical protein